MDRPDAVTATPPGEDSARLADALSTIGTPDRRLLQVLVACLVGLAAIELVGGGLLGGRLAVAAWVAPEPSALSRWLAAAIAAVVSLLWVAAWSGFTLLAATALHLRHPSAWRLAVVASAGGLASGCLPLTIGLLAVLLAPRTRALCARFRQEPVQGWLPHES